MTGTPLIPIRRSGVWQIALLICGTLFCWPPLAAEDEPATRRYADPPMPRFRVVKDDFEASEADIHALLTSTGRELWRHFPNYEIEPFVVLRGRSGPIVLHDRDDGEIVMRLDTGKTYWAQYAFQFGHEFCHILCKYEDDYQGNQWFEESLCETASLFVLRQMADAWQDDPPHTHWRSYRKHLRSYADDRLKFEPVIEPVDFASFVRAKQDELLKDPKHAEFQRSVALALLPKFEAEPQRWESIRWLNTKPAEEGETLAASFEKWHAAVPERHRAFVVDVAKLFEVELPAP